MSEDLTKERKDELIAELLASINEHKYGPEVAHVEVHGNQVLGAHLVEGLEVSSRPFDHGVEIFIRVREGAVIKNPVHFCFGVIPADGLQKIVSHTVVERGAGARFLAHCTFPNAVKVVHVMDADIEIGAGAKLEYLERHVHGPAGGVTLTPKSRVVLREGARFSTEFELIKGAAGAIDLDYQAVCGKDSVVDMKTRIFGRGSDEIHVREAARLEGEAAVGVLTSHIALKDRASAVIDNEIVADAPFARGHVDCKEIVQGEARARAVPIVQVNDHRAHVTHEAAIGSVDSKQLETLMSRGLGEEEATDLIIAGLLR
jgi:Fe-S cluster assembly scaffold protein SufB